MAEIRHACEGGLTAACFEAHPQYAKKVFAYRLMHTLCPARMTRGLRKSLWKALAQFPLSWVPPSDFILPPGSTWDMVFPADWTPDDPLPEGVTIDPGFRVSIEQLQSMDIFIEPGKTWENGFPNGWDPASPLPEGASWEPYDMPPIYGPGGCPPLYLAPWEPGPVHRPSPAPAGAAVPETFTAQNDGRQGTWLDDWQIAHDIPEGLLVFMPETRTTWAINCQADAIDRGCVRSFFDFDLSSIPAGAVISACTLALQSYGADVCNATIQQGTQSDELNPGDYGSFAGSFFDMITWAAGQNIFTLNAAGLAYIESKCGDTAKLCMREYDHDYSNVEPAEGEIFQAGIYWSSTGVVAYRPLLTVTYTT